MKNILLLVALLAVNIQAQTILKFDRRLVECEGRWVAFMPGNDSSLNFGFVYIDIQSGLSLNYAGHFTITNAGTFIPTLNINKGGTFIVRLKPNQTHVALIPESKFIELKIPELSKLLLYNTYRVDTSSVGALYSRGYMFNEWEECAKALHFLEKAYKIDANYKGLAVELAFSYNCSGQYNKAILVLNSVLEANPTDAYFHKELIYAEVNSGQLDKAAESCKKALAACTDNTQFNGEMCYTLLRGFYYKRDKLNFNLWLNEGKKWTASNEFYLSNLKKMEEDVAKW